MGVVLLPWLRCVCGKVHVRAWCGPTSKCTCGRNLHEQAWQR